MDQIHDITINYLYYLYHVNFTPPIYGVNQKKGRSQKTKINHGGVFLKKKSMTNKIKEFRQGEL